MASNLIRVQQTLQLGVDVVVEVGEHLSQRATGFEHTILRIIKELALFFVPLADSGIVALFSVLLHAPKSCARPGRHLRRQSLDGRQRFDRILLLHGSSSRLTVSIGPQGVQFVSSHDTPVNCPDFRLLSVLVCLQTGIFRNIEVNGSAWKEQEGSGGGRKEAELNGQEESAPEALDAPGMIF